ncbi:pectate lyase [Nibricoccus aquaticus]|uniref:Pectate lyase n=1 Tax=Nibricoccus aquaticus TaxID=2576891 RepID=A0A290Q870_9BACT|nr:Ig-like domain-containing protein [Nibricoccus aquaticus]ATC63360.1 pectate lyase [Nibricoccus aquaticus]
MHLPRSLAFGLTLSALLSSASAQSATPLKVDFSIPGRSDAIAPHFNQWPVKNGASDEKEIAGLSFKLTHRGPGKGIATTWWKFGALEGSRMAVDGVTLDNGDTTSVLELRMRGLTPGPHTLVTYHNISEDDSKNPYGKIDIAINGTAQISGLTPSRRATDETAAFAYLTFNATAGQEVVIAFTPSPASADPSAKRRNIILNGFELDASSPALRARQPSPAHGDYHTDADTAPLSLTWVPAASAVTHHVYLGTSLEAVANATPQSPEYRGPVSKPAFSPGALSPLVRHFWRIDEVDAAGLVTRGEVWSFQPRRVAFPGAEGYGRFALGGRGGRVIEVTNLNDSGPGSLRAAVEADGPRTVVFTVSGLITLESKLPVRNPFITIAGQTAPGKGITIRKYNLGLLGAHDSIIRHLRVRPGNIAGVTLDGMGMAGTDHAIFDHCSISWTIDESFSSRGAKNITLQRTLISEALNAAGHKNYEAGKPHGFAASIGGDIGSFHHNLLAHNYGRNWSLAGGLGAGGAFTGRLDITNNVVYNWGRRATDGGAHEVNFVNNYYKPGAATTMFYALNAQYGGFPGTQRYYFAGNVMPGKFDEKSQKKGRMVSTELGAKMPTYEVYVDQPFFPSHVTTQSARHAYKVVLSDVGANAPALDNHDTRMISETLAGTYSFKGSKTGLPGMPDTQVDSGGWEALPEIRRDASWDTDHDGLPDWWEKLHGSNPASPANDYSDSNADRDANGFTDLEDYLAWMATPRTSIPAGQPTELPFSILSNLTAGFTDKPVFTVASAKNGELVILPDGKAARFTPAPGFTGLASFTFTVTDAEGDSLTRTVNLLVQ